MTTVCDDVQVIDVPEAEPAVEVTPDGPDNPNPTEAAPDAALSVPEALMPVPRVALLPPQLAGLAKVAAKESRRSSMTGVYLQLLGEGFAAVATDGKRLLEVVGPYPADFADYPALPALADEKAGGGSEAILPVKAWTESFRNVPKNGCKPVLKTVAVALGREEQACPMTTFATTDLEQANVSQTRHVEGRFPKYREAFPKGAPKAAVRLNAKLLVELLTTMVPLAGADPYVTVELRGKDDPVVIRAKGDQTVTTGLIMPIA